MSGITFNAQIQKIGKPANLKSLWEQTNKTPPPPKINKKQMQKKKKKEKGITNNG